MDRYKFFLAFGLLLVFSTVSDCQEPERKIEIESSFGILFFDEDLSSAATPSFGLGAGYNITDFLQLNLTLLYSPTQQRIPAATSKIITDVSVYTYTFNLRFVKQRPLFLNVRPVASIGAGGILFSQRAVRINLGAGQTVQLNSSRDHRYAVNFGAGFEVAISQKFQIVLNYNKYLYRIEKALDDDVNTRTETAASDYFGMRFKLSF